MIHAFIIGGLLFAFGHYQSGEYPRWSYYCAFLISAVSSIATGYYFVAIEQSGDTLAYYEAATRLNQASAGGFIDYFRSIYTATLPAHSSNWHSVFFIKLISPLVYVSGANYWLSGLYLTLINFFCSWVAVRYLQALLDRKWLVYGAIFLVPSVTIWSGGIFKEALANGLFLMVITISLYRLKDLSMPTALEITLLLLSGFLLIQLRFYLFGSWIALIVFAVWFKLFSEKKMWLWVGVFTLLVASFLGAQLLHPWLRPTRLPLTLFEIYEQLTSSPSGTSFTLPTFQPDYWHLVVTAPLALFTGLFRPAFFDIQEWQWLPFQLEKLVYLLFFIWTLWKIRSTRISTIGVLACCFIAMLTIALTLVTPNFGSLLRYQSAYIPFLVLILGWIPLRKLDHRN